MNKKKGTDSTDCWEGGKGWSYLLTLPSLILSDELWLVLSQHHPPLHLSALPHFSNLSSCVGPPPSCFASLLCHNAYGVTVGWATSCLLSSRTPGSDRSNYYGMSRFVLHVGPPATSAEPQEFLPADHSIGAFASTASNAAKHIFKNTIFSNICICSI